MQKKIEKLVSLNVVGTEYMADCQQPVLISIPFKRGAVWKTDNLRLSTWHPSTFPSCLKETGYWSDGSVKWATLRTITDSRESVPSKLVLRPDEAIATSPSLRTVETGSNIRIQDRDMVYEFNTRNKQIFPNIYVGKEELWRGENFSINFVSSDSQRLDFEWSSFDLEEQSEVSVLAVVSGEVVVSRSKKIRVSFHFEIIYGGWLKLGVRLHNPHRAKHKGGFWDLGDEGSIKLHEFSIEIPFGKNDNIRYRAESNQDWKEVRSANTKIFQSSSGGDNWNSINHIDASGNVGHSFKGYRIQDNYGEMYQGKRANPLIWVSAETGINWGLTVAQYWQNFPKCLEFKESSLNLGLFPSEHEAGFELQGGERKHHEIVFSFSGDDHTLDWVDKAVTLNVSKSQLVESQCLSYIGKNNEFYDGLISKSLCYEQGFIAKREIIDEYGWRNFGEIFADHESLYRGSSEPFISHYNNQYDPIYGFGRQFLLTGDVRWFRLMHDLVRHVLDIDIYRTDEDRGESNNGLFWHTDHYRNAHTCTHRTYSVVHAQCGSNGGGPASEHCYTSGLYLYYQLTGEEEARETVLKLADWIRNYHEGSGSVLEYLKNLVTFQRRKFISICKRERIFKYKYEFGRGTGNYIRALLDSFEATNEKHYIFETENIIMSTFSCNDDLTVRDLFNIETTWFYTIFLQEIVRYLDLKRQLNEMDSSFEYARAGLLHYADWMVEHETPYLDRSEDLEFPNDTWVAQDIRKANVLFAAYKYSVDKRDRFIVKSRFFRDYVLQTLTESDTLHFARIQSVLLQNHGPSSFMDDQSEPYEGLSTLPDNNAHQDEYFYTLPSFLLSEAKQLIQCLSQFSLSREVAWVKARVGR